MGNSISARYGHFAALWKEGLWGRWLGVVYSLAGAYVLVRDEFWRPKNPDQWWIINMIPHLSAWWLVSALVVLCVLLFETSFRITERLNESIASALRSQESPLEIIFDPTNPGRTFWSIEPMKGENGKQIAGSFWEYRAVIKNKSVRTVRNVKVTVEAIGDMPTRPEHSQFDINKKPLIDLTPNEETLAVIRRWFNPPIVKGMVGEGAYGPIKMTASADDVLPTTKVFQFDPERTPMIFELDADAQKFHDTSRTL
jgi:hypothetical protein